jgi:hypothetical protein
MATKLDKSVVTGVYETAMASSSSVGGVWGRKRTKGSHSLMARKVICATNAGRAVPPPPPGPTATA